ncbi:hypothetical protein D7V93_32145 [Corallococcus llansteffanensis]|uniref:Uncharacterized protein n=1 Tax=Corallococcus llansteffanensis TaxID=2316731 RepID=A0A3A8PC20_9BACT|nr:hypothetical protein D7V93_32145 [Corallococcus llansteffanensis]
MRRPWESTSCRPSRPDDTAPPHGAHATAQRGRDTDEAEARHAPPGAAEVRWRVLEGKRYALGTGGTLLLPTSEGTPRPGAFA